jgi:hypothetical protein
VCRPGGQRPRTASTTVRVRTISPKPKTERRMDRGPPLLGPEVLAKMTVLTGKSSAHAEEVNAIDAVGA